MVNATPTRERLKALKVEAKKLSSALRRTEKISKIEGIDVDAVRRQIEERLEKVQSGIESLEASGQIRIEDLAVYKIDKINKKGTVLEYWQAGWREGGSVHSVHLGSCRELTQEDALEKARKIKRRRLGIDNLPHSSGIGQSTAL